MDKQDIANLDAAKLTTAQLIDHVKARNAAGAAPATVNNDVIALRVTFKYARRAWGMPLNLSVIEDAAEVLRESRLIGKAKTRDRRPSADELERLGAYYRMRWASRPRKHFAPMYLVLWFAIYSARRLDEICRLRREDFHEESGTYRVFDLKPPDGSDGNNKEAVLPPKGWEVVRDIMRIIPDRDGRLIPCCTDIISARFGEACKILGIEDLVFHDMRHEAASRLAEDEYTIPKLQQVTLHESWASLSIYVILPARRDRRVDYQPMEGV
jgi:integrase